MRCVPVHVSLCMLVFRVLRCTAHVICGNISLKTTRPHFAWRIECTTIRMQFVAYVTYTTVGRRSSGEWKIGGYVFGNR